MNTGRPPIVLSNDFAVPASAIAIPGKSRWRLESVLQRLRLQLCFRRFLGAKPSLAIGAQSGQFNPSSLAMTIDHHPILVIVTLGGTCHRTLSTARNLA
jgi:hypothetical protein